MEEDPFKNMSEITFASDLSSDSVEPTNEVSHVQNEAKVRELIASMEYDTMLREPFAEKVQAFVDKCGTNEGNLCSIADQIEAYRKVKEYDLRIQDNGYGFNVKIPTVLIQALTEHDVTNHTTSFMILFIPDKENCNRKII